MPTLQKRRRATKGRSVRTKPKITKAFASQVAAFIERYRPALEALAKR